MNKIITVSNYTNVKPLAYGWAREHNYRNVGLNALKDIDADAMTLFSNVDEIVSPH